MTSTFFKGHMYSLIHEFTIRKCFDLKYQSPLEPKIIWVNWCFPNHDWIKCNTDGALRENLEILTCGDIFRDNLGTLLGAFSIKIEVYSYFQAGLYEILFAIEYANKMNWRICWLKIDSMLVFVHFLMWILFFSIF